MVKALRATLRKLAQLTIWRYRPGVVGVTGSVGKTSTKLAIKAVLEKERRVRISAGNLNSDLGLPLTVLGDWSARDLALVSRETPFHTRRWAKAMFWLKVIFVSLWQIAFKSSDYPEILILEYGADHPGDIKYLLSVVRPNISVITAIGDVPVHVEFYEGPEEVAREKGRIIECLPAGGFAILNYDDDVVMGLKERTRARVMTFGFRRGAEVQVTRFEHKVRDEKPVGISFKLEHSSNIVPVRIENVFGKVQAYASAAAASVGLIFGMNLVTIAEALASYAPASGRMNLLPGIKESFIIDDSYNASPLSMRAALDTLRLLPAHRRIAVLGDMLEIGTYSVEAHEALGPLVAESCDLLFTVGPRAKFIAGAAQRARMRKTAIVSFDNADEAWQAVQSAIRIGDLVLVKGSHAMQLEKVVEAVKLASPVEPSSSSPV